MIDWIFFSSSLFSPVANISSCKSLLSQISPLANLSCKQLLFSLVSVSFVEIGLHRRQSCAVMASSASLPPPTPSSFHAMVAPPWRFPTSILQNEKVEEDALLGSSHSRDREEMSKDVVNVAKNDEEMSRDKVDVTKVETLNLDYEDDKEKSSYNEAAGDGEDMSCDKEETPSMDGPPPRRQKGTTSPSPQPCP